MVIAGPGTGKTELLSMRAANILKKTDTLPESILCLTFTDSGAAAMRERLTKIIGKDAYKVAIHTFHSFGSEVINQHGEYFYQGAHFRPADDLATHEILTAIFNELDHDSLIASKMNGEFTYLRDAMTAISDLKRSGLTSDELLNVIEANTELLDTVEPDLVSIFSSRVNVGTADQLRPLVEKSNSLPEPNLPAGITPLAQSFSLSLSHALEDADAQGSTKPVTAWKNKWLTKDTQGRIVFKDRSRHDKLRAISFVYFKYLSRMQEAELFDYDDMILRVTHALEVFDDLRFNLQEKYQYIMVDEFQDTNLVQMRILSNLTSHPANEGMPNILVVGDDDQAIYSFQGADISNILSFRDHYPKAQLIPLVDNYRSGEEILATARSVITQGEDRLEQRIDELDKTLTAHRPGQATVSLVEAETEADERQWLVNEIAQQIKQGVSPSSIAVLTRRHAEIAKLLPYFMSAGISVAYERRDNVLQLDPVVMLVKLARIVTLLSTQKLDQADQLLPELIAHPAWGIDAHDLWKLSLTAYDNRSRWLDTMATMPAFTDIHKLLIELAAKSLVEPFEPLLDQLMGFDRTDDETPVSPLREFYFSAEKLNDQPDTYLTYLEGLRTIRSAIRDHYTTETVDLASFVEFVDLYSQTGQALTSIRRSGNQTDSVNLMTAHKSKGLEFDLVYVTGVVDSAWGERVRSRSRLISYPENLPIGAVGDSVDERLRLFFVAITRAKAQLTMSYAKQSDTGKSLDRASFVAELTPELAEPSASNTADSQIDDHWYMRLTEPVNDLKVLLQPTLDNYKLSATHLGNFLDVSRGGPKSFLINNLLRFPQAMSPDAAYGSAIHAALQKAHSHLSATQKRRALEDILRDFETELAQHRLSESDVEKYNQRGTAALQEFLGQHYDSFATTQKVELNFAGQNSLVERAHLTGKLDLVDFDEFEREIIVTDYKTGHPAASWKGKTDYEKMKLHRYRQQLMFYKLLVENSRSYHNYTVTKGVLQFVEPTREGEVLELTDDFSQTEIEEFAQLINRVWDKIVSLDLPDTSQYEQNYKGMLAFEKDLIDGNI